MGSLTLTRFDMDGPALLTPARHGDSRGWFCEVWNQADWLQAGLPNVDWVQDNEAFSQRAGTLRGLHFQRPPHAQAKLVRVLSGAILDVAVDLRPGSATYGHSVTARLTAASSEQLYVPRGFAHGYQTLEADTCVAYKCDAAYAPDAEAGVMWNDPALGIDWPLADAILSDKDKYWPSMADLANPFEDA